MFFLISARIRVKMKVIRFSPSPCPKVFLNLVSLYVAQTTSYQPQFLDINDDNYVMES